MRIGIYAGSFDPITYGHEDLITRSLSFVDRLVVAVATNISKQPLFSVEERIRFIRSALADDPRVEVRQFDGLLVDLARSVGATLSIRGLRAVADFEYELQMANMNRHLYVGMETVFLMANDAYFYVSSNIVKEAASLGGDVSALVPPSVSRRLKAKLGR